MSRSTENEEGKERLSEQRKTPENKEQDPSVVTREAVQQVETLAAFGDASAQRMAAEHGEPVVATEVSVALAEVKLEGAQALLKFVSQKFADVAKGADDSLEKAKQWAMKVMKEIGEDLDLIRMSAIESKLDSFKGTTPELVAYFISKTKGTSIDPARESNKYSSIGWRFTRVVEARPPTEEGFVSLLAYWRTIPRDAKFSKQLAQKIVSLYIKGQTFSEPTYPALFESTDALERAPDLYTAGGGLMGVDDVPREKARDIFESLGEYKADAGQARFVPDDFSPEDFSGVRKALFEAYVANNKANVLTYIERFEEDLAAMDEATRDELLDQSIDEIQYLSLYNFGDYLTKPFLKERHFRRLLNKITKDGQYSINDVLENLWSDNAQIAYIKPDVANALEIPKEKQDQMFASLMENQPVWLLSHAKEIGLNEHQIRVVEETARERATRIGIEDLKHNLSWEMEKNRQFALDQFERLAKIDVQKAKDFFFHTYHKDLYDHLPEEAYQKESTWNPHPADRLHDLLAVQKSPLLWETYGQIIEDFSADAIKDFASRVYTLGSENAQAFFAARKEEWDTHPENRWSIMEEFLMEEQELVRLAEEKVAAEIVELEEVPEGVVAVELKIPSLQHDPSWYDETRIPSYPEQDDDKDYSLPSELATIENLPKHSLQDVRVLYRAMAAGNRESMRVLVERMVGLGEVPAEKFEFIASALEDVAKLWGTGEVGEEMAVQREKLKNIEKLAPLPVSADRLTIRNHVLQKSRVIPSFSDSLRMGYLTEAALAYAVQLSRKKDSNQMSVVEQMVKVETTARSLYKNVVENGVPVFRDFIVWVNEEHKKAGASYPGEFYVGRDTQMTLHTAANAIRWGKMDGTKRRALTVHVDVSRPILNKRSGSTEFHETMKAWLKQEGVTEKMLGIDGGYSGSSPTGVFEALGGKLSSKELNNRIRLVETHYYNERRFNPRKAYSGLVAWMEALPKFTERSQDLKKNEFGKYFVVSSRRSPSERALAWTVQQATWRELINYDLVAHKDDTLTEFPLLGVDTEEVPDEPIQILDADIDLYNDNDTFSKY
jgi:hypothetical protein